MKRLRFSKQLKFVGCLIQYKANAKKSRIEKITDFENEFENRIKIIIFHEPAISKHAAHSYWQVKRKRWQLEKWIVLDYHWLNLCLRMQFVKQIIDDIFFSLKTDEQMNAIINAVIMRFVRLAQKGVWDSRI